MARLTGKDVDTKIGDYIVHIEEVTVSIEDNSKAVKSRGRPNGFINGSVGASGDITVDTANLNIIIDAAKKAGSFQQIDPLDISFNAETTTDKLNIELFECKLKISDLLNATGSGDDKLTHKIGYDVTGLDFVRINGVPYAPDENKETLI